MDKPRIPLVWVRNLEGEAKDKYVQRLVNDDLLDHLRAILEARLEALREEETTIEFFSQGSLEKLIFNRGRESELRDIMRLVTF